MFEVHGEGSRAPTLKEAADQLHVDVKLLDPVYGVQLVDPRDHTYVVRSAAREMQTDVRAYVDLAIDVF